MHLYLSIYIHASKKVVSLNPIFFTAKYYCKRLILAPLVEFLKSRKSRKSAYSDGHLVMITFLTESREEKIQKSYKAIQYTHFTIFKKLMPIINKK